MNSKSIKELPLKEYQLLIEKIPLGIVISDSDGMIILANKIMEEKFGYSKEEFNNMSVNNIFANPKDLEKLQEILVKEQKVRDFELIMKTKNGKEFISILNIDEEEREGEKIFYSTMQDVSKQKIISKKLKESEEKFRLIVENRTDLIAKIDARGFYLYVSPTYLETLEGYENLTVNQVYKSFVHPDDYSSTSKAMKNLFSPPFKSHYENRVKTNHGWKWYSWVDTAILDEKNRIKEIISVGRDISDIKETEAKLKKSEEKYRIFVENQTDLLAEIDIEGNYTFFNQNFREMFGNVENTPFLQTFVEITHKDDLERSIKMLRNLLKPPYTVKFETRIKSKEGWKWYSWVTNGIIKNDKRVEGFVTVGRDITEMKQIQEILAESEEKYRVLFENSPYAVGLIDLTGKVVDINQNVEKLFGYKKNEIIGENFTSFDLFSKDDIKIIAESFKILIKQKTPEPKELKIKRKDGKIIDVSIIASLVNLHKTTLFLIITQDITERKEAQRKLEEQNVLLKDISQYKSELLSRTSHELKTPLISIKGFTDLLLQFHSHKMDIDIKTLLFEIREGSRRLEKIIKSLLESSQLEQGKIQLNPEKLNLSFLINFCVGEMKGIAELRNHKVLIDVQESLIAIFDKEAIYDVISNLLLNALKYTPSPGNILIQSMIYEDYYKIIVKDNGIGLSEKDQKRLFKQFGKIERYGEGLNIDTDGTGLGLYISKKIVELHGGEIGVKSAGRGEGSSFFFTLPII